MLFFTASILSQRLVSVSLSSFTHCHDDDGVSHYTRNIIQFVENSYFSPGYGHIAPATVAGQIFTIAYAIIGIPVFLILLTDFGKLFTRIIKFLWVRWRNFIRFMFSIFPTIWYFRRYSFDVSTIPGRVEKCEKRLLHKYVRWFDKCGKFSSKSFFFSGCNARPKRDVRFHASTKHGVSWSCHCSNLAADVTITFSSTTHWESNDSSPGKSSKLRSRWWVQSADFTGDRHAGDLYAFRSVDLLHVGGMDVFSSVLFCVCFN